VATSRIACLVFLATIGRQVSPLYTPEDFLDSRVGTLPAINNPRTAALMVQRGHRDQLPSNYGVARRVEPEAKFFNDFSRARACARAQGSVGSDSAGLRQYHHRLGLGSGGSIRLEWLVERNNKPPIDAFELATECIAEWDKFFQRLQSQIL
jgi:hypothetical protein